jgi:hypothetical protein
LCLYVKASVDYYFQKRFGVRAGIFGRRADDILNFNRRMQLYIMAAMPDWIWINGCHIIINLIIISARA